MTTKASATNQRIADDLGITHSMVSRIRSGDRLPSLQLVRRINVVYGWSIEEQISSLDPKTYAVEFEKLLGRRYG